MTSSGAWRLSISASQRFDNVQNLKRLFDQEDDNAKTETLKFAMAKEAEVFKASDTVEQYITACSHSNGNETSDNPTDEPLLTAEPTDSGITIGSHTHCHRLASGIVSEVYRSATVAIKVITETHGVEPHDYLREAKILRSISHPNIITLLETDNDEDNRPILVFPYHPFTLLDILRSERAGRINTPSVFHDLFSALSYLHRLDIIHRDIKPSNVLLASPEGPAFLADFGTAWHPQYSKASEPPEHKVIEVGTTCYRAPETLFGNRKYDTSLDLWAIGTMLAECLRTPPQPLFDSPETYEDGNQLGLILSIFKTLGTPTKESWPEAVHFSTPPFDWYAEFPGRTFEDLLPSVSSHGRSLVKDLVRFESGSRLTADKVGIKLTNLEYTYSAD